MTTEKEVFWPEIITNLPEASIPIEGLRSHIFQGQNQQIVFMSFENDVDVPEHCHEAQWGVVLDGETELTMTAGNTDWAREILTLFPKTSGIVRK